MKQQDLTQKQFGDQAQNYLSSAVHAQGAEFEQIINLAQQRQAQNILDLGCGAGHVSFYLAAACQDAQITAYDLSDKMLAVVAAEAGERGFTNITTQQGMVEKLPFTNNQFDLVVTRYSAHHWLDVPKALSEIKRVLKPQGKCVIVDAMSPETPLLDTALQTLELLRDASHVRDYRISEWYLMLGQQGFAPEQQNRWKVALDFESWVKRINTPDAGIEALKTVMSLLPQEVRDYYQMEDDIWQMDVMMVVASNNKVS